MDPLGGGPHVFRDTVDECDHIMFGHLFDLKNPLCVEGSLFLDLLQVLSRDHSHLRVGLTNSYFNLQPFLVLVLLRPDISHLLSCVPFDHSVLVSLGVGNYSLIR